MPTSKTTKPGWKQVNYRLPLDLREYIGRWKLATGLDREIIVEQMLRAYMEMVGDPPKPSVMPKLPKKP